MTAIEFENISKQYRLGLVSTRTISHDLNRWWQMNILRREDPYLKIGDVNDRASKGESEYVWALKDINFKVEQGDVLGIIGKNGAGKSTLLKILSKVTSPTTGTIKARGRIASLLEVGTGFHPEMTGRENIYMNGAIMGMTKAEITRKLDEIVDFAGVERYIDTPVKRYSSGMTVRLGFAIAAHLEPEILVVDEVLAVGDAEFQKKAIGKMQDVSRSEGRTVLFVSHNMAAVKSLCTKGLVLENGTCTFRGEVEEAIDYYLTEDSVENFIIDKMEILNPDLTVNKIVVNNLEGNRIQINDKNSNVKIQITGELRNELAMGLEMYLFDLHDSLLGVFSPSHKSGVTEVYKPGKFNIEHEFNLPSNLSKGEFYFDIELNQTNVCSLMVVRKNLFVDSQGYPSKTGFEFDYSKRGLLVL
ncbi:MAG TPA: ABC transporter ATP-binding protein [Bacteroidales bacterium]|nr:ABC transporter ATP-binding protein [Bacteroidales bacterium]